MSSLREVALLRLAAQRLVGEPHATPADVVGVLDDIRAVVADLAPGVPLAGLLYGGSVSTGNAAELLALEQVDGLFVGRAAWTPEGFTALLSVAGEAAASRARTSPTPGPSPG